VAEFSIVCPVRNEVDLIPKTLPSFYALNPSEVILCVDKPAPKDVTKVIDEVAKACRCEGKTRILEVERNREFRFHQAWVRREGFRKASNDLILTADIDIIVSPEVTRYLNMINKSNVMLVSFSKLAYPITFRSAVAWFVQRAYRHSSFTGLYAFSRKAWQETEDVSSLKRIPRGEDTHLHKFITKKYNTVFVAGVKNIVLRPKESPQYQYLMGWNRWKIRRTPLWRVTLSVFLYFRPFLLAGYLKARLS
jgi:glycosyltransferase involved in cell wall biosynthesis